MSVAKPERLDAKIAELGRACVELYVAAKKLRECA